MTERFATNTPPVVPSNAAASGHGQPHHPAHQSFTNTGKHAQVGQHQLQPTIYYYNPQVQQVVHSHSQHVHVQQGQRAFTSPQSTTQPLTTNASQATQRRASLQQSRIAALPNTQPPTQGQAQRLPKSVSAASDQALRERIVSLLSSTANGCIQELGYPTVISQYKHLEADHSKLIEEHNALRAEHAKLKNDLTRLARLALQQREESKKLLDTRAKTIQDLTTENKQLKERVNRLIVQCNMLQQSSTLDASDAYKLLENKYQYALELIRKHRLVAVPVDRKGENHSFIELSTSPGSESINTPIDQADIRDGGSSHKTGLPPDGSSSRPDTVPQQFVQGSSTQASRSLKSAPPTLIPQAATPPDTSSTTPIPTRSNSLPPSSSAAVSHLPASTVQVFPNPVSRPADDHSAVYAPAQNQRHASPTSTFATPVALDRPEQPPEGSTHPSSMQESLLHPADTRRSTPQRSPTTSADCASVIHEVDARPVEEEKPQLTVQTSVEHPARRATPTPPSPVAAGSAHGSGSTATSSPPASSAPRGPVPTDARKSEEPQRPISPMKSDTPSTTVAPLTPKDSHSMDIDEEGQIREADIGSQDVVMSESKLVGATEGHLTPAPADPSVGDTLPPSTDVEEGEVTEEDEDEDEDEDMDWGDLTDDESEKRPVFDCICIIFEDDDESGERRCTFCDYQMEQDNDPDPRPVFTGWSYRNLAVHAKTEHKVAWAKLRRNGL